ncbi:MAG: hypothetical protein ACJ780_03725 [Solirubrobacteraceae bacterium]
MFVILIKRLRARLAALRKPEPVPSETPEAPSGPVACVPAVDATLTILP